ncbi:FIG00992611: hypothetical protein [hydrothermal vent metagenome]|uniref:SseB protein N-terminal domain-containing protein n=1 Tax=hydrothermal vent metagenome TaxID=652676 RepID=A0A3B0R4K6_9ZZZZ
MSDTLLDIAHAQMQSRVNDDAARLGFYEKLAGAELFLLLKSEASGDEITPEVFELPENSYVLAFDRHDRLTGFTGGPAPYAALSGQVICKMLSENNLGLGLNLDVAPSSTLIPPEAVRWLAAMESTPEQHEEKASKFSVPKGLPEEFLSLLDTRLAAAMGLAPMAYLVGVSYESGAQGHLLAFIDARPAAHKALVQTVAQALVFSGLNSGALDVAFFAASDPVTASLAKTGLRFDLPQPAEYASVAPGSDPKKPPILR